jgi:Ca2+/H+ antiporter
MADEENAAPTVWSGAKEMFTGSYLNVLLVAIPFALLSEWTGWSDSATFAFSLLAIAPLAERLGFVTEQLALHTNDSIGALLNVTFGNATELIVAISALTKGLFRVVQLTLLGSVLSNMLLVLGCAFLFGGLKYSTQYFNKITSQANMTLLMLSVMGLLFPTVLTLSDTESLGGQLGLSRCCAIILFLMYCLFIYFQLVTHRHVFEERPQSEIDAISRTASLSSASSTASVNPIHERMSAQAQAELAKDDSESGSDVEAGTDGVAMLVSIAYADAITSAYMMNLIICIESFYKHPIPLTCRLRKPVQSGLTCTHPSQMMMKRKAIPIKLNSKSVRPTRN